jgi:antitoxin FitA
MPNVLVRDLPDDVHARLQRRAETQGQSLQRFLSTELTRLATAPSMSDVLARIARHKGPRRLRSCCAGSARRTQPALIVIDASLLANVVAAPARLAVTG